MNTTLPVCQPMTTVQNIQLGIALAAITKQEIAVHIGGSVHVSRNER
jgi:hypothetical protein